MIKAIKRLLRLISLIFARPIIEAPIPEPKKPIQPPDTASIPDEVYEAQKPERKQKYIYVIDAGHGGINHEGKYTTAPAKMFEHPHFTFYEGAFNRRIQSYLFQMLDKEGIKYLKANHQYIDTPLSDRVRVANVQKQPAIFFSIHGNAASSPKATGIEYFTSKGETDSDKIASKMYELTEKYIPELRLRKDYTDKDPDKEADFYVLRKTNCPAVLAEFGFFTNPKEAELMMTSHFQKRCAMIIFDTIKWIEQNM